VNVLKFPNATHSTLVDYILKQYSNQRKLHWKKHLAAVGMQTSFLVSFILAQMVEADAAR